MPCPHLILILISHTLDYHAQFWGNQSRCRRHLWLIPKCEKGLLSALKTTALDYGQASSIHGIGYILESGKNLLSSRVIWVLVVSMASLMGILWSVEASDTM